MIRLDNAQIKQNIDVQLDLITLITKNWVGNT